MVGAHHPSDVIASICLSLFVALVYLEMDKRER